MAEVQDMNRRSFLRNTVLGGAGATLLGTPVWEAAAQMVNGSGTMPVNGVGLDDPLLVQLSINENPLGASHRAIEAVAGKMFGMNRYTMHFELEEALAAHHGVDAETVFTGVGSSEILLTATLAAFWDRPGNAVTAFPSYRSIPRTAEELGQAVKRVPLTGDWQMDLPAMLAAVDENTRIVSICNPNNPTGQILDAAELERTIRAMPKDVIVCVDEAYIQFVDDPDYPSMIALTKEVENLLISRTFSKAYGLGGMRVGYGVAHPALLERMQRFSIGLLNKNTLSTVAALAALGDQEHVRRTVEITRQGKTFLYEELEAMGYTPIRTQTIFVTVEVGPNVNTLIDRLWEKKVYVRQAFDMEGFMRISVGLPRENESFISAFKRERSAL
jgi:histidinol-phosphate aminotransferase